MRIFKCWFCSSPIYPGHGMTFVRNDCKEFRFCRKKCRRGFEKKKNPRKVKWTKAFRKSANKELGDNSVFAFEKKRNLLVKYDRDLMQKTVTGMKKVDEIRRNREKMHIMNRLRRGTELRRLDDVKTVKTQMHLIQAPHATKATYKTGGIEVEDMVEIEEEDIEDFVEEMEVETEVTETKKSLAKKAQAEQLSESKSVKKKVKIVAKQ